MAASDYHVTIGIECHVQLKTKTKLFAAVDNDARDAQPNTLISHICLGMPGALPVLNEEVIHMATKAAFAFNTKPQHYSFFERKHYFYPDLPKGYQITQLSHPIIQGGTVEIEVDGSTSIIHLNRVQIEEDAGKNIHPAGADYSLVDLNRAGTPLLEIVSEPDIHSPAEAKAYARELYLLMRYADVSDADLFYGNMRFDVNVSVSKDPNKLGTRTETKNLNSFRSVEKAAEYEIKRQIELLEKGETITQETRGWDDAKQKTLSQRGKEEAHDYRYMPEPDVPPVELSDAYIDKISQEMPVLPKAWRHKLKDLGMESEQIDTLLEAEVENDEQSYLTLINQHLSKKDVAKFLANWAVNVVVPLRREAAIKLSQKDVDQLLMDICDLSLADKLSSTAAKNLFQQLAALSALPSSIGKYAEEQGFIQLSDENELAEIVKQVIADNPQAANDIQSGETKAIGYLVGQVMRASQGKANPEVARKLIQSQLQ